MRVQRHASGSVRYDRRRKTWNYLWYESGKHRSKLIGTKHQYPTKASAWAAVVIPAPREKTSTKSPTIQTLVEQYRNEKMPERYSTRRAYECWLRNHIIPFWGSHQLSELQARPAEQWLLSLALAPKSKSHVRAMLHVLWDYAMWRGDVPTQRNPMELVTVKGASKRTRVPRSLTVEEFRYSWSTCPTPSARLHWSVCASGFASASAWRWCGRTWIGCKQNSAWSAALFASESGT
jgi:hypothetical protein